MFCLFRPMLTFSHFKLLNEKNDDDEDSRAGLKKQNELLSQLLKDPDEERKLQEQRDVSIRTTLYLLIATHVVYAYSIEKKN